MKPGVEARVAAAEMLRRVTDEGAYSNRLAASGRDGRDLSERDRRFAQHLLFTALRDLPRIDRAIAAASARSVDGLDPPVRSVLRVAIGELLAPDPAVHAAVDAAVDAVRVLNVSKATGFVNAVLRRVSREGEEPLPEGREGLALRLGVAPWLLAQVSAAVGPERAVDLLAALRREAGVGVRMRRRRPGVEFESAPGFPSSVGYAAPGSTLAAAAERGDAVVIDPASSAVAIAVRASPGETILDMAAAPGGKTAHLADAMGGRGLLVAADRHSGRASRARRRLARLGIEVPWIVMDGARPAVRAGRWDAILLDAPCTGLGTLRRRPEIAHRLRPDMPSRMGDVQRRLLASALSLVRPGGRVVYSACTVFAEETVDVVAGYPARPPEGLPGVVWENGLLLGPDTTGTDGMFISVIEV